MSNTINKIKTIIRKLLSVSYYKTLPVTLVKKSPWYHSLFPDYDRISHVGFNNQILCFGSTPGKYAFDFAESTIKGYNLSIGPETLEYDFNMLKSFHSYLDEGGKRIVLLTLCPMSLCKSEYKEKDGATYLNYRYYPFLHRAFLPNFDKVFYDRYVKHPQCLWKDNWKIITKSYLKTDRYFLKRNPLSNTQMRESAKCFVSSWAREFEWEALDSNKVPGSVLQALSFNTKLLMDINQFCGERDIHPFIVLPPISEELLLCFSDNFRTKFIYDIINKSHIPYLDYLENDSFKDDKYFVDALCLNAYGRKEFTKMVINDIKNNA